jgi:hypothetical protein
VWVLIKEGAGADVVGVALDLKLFSLRWSRKRSMKDEKAEMGSRVRICSFSAIVSRYSGLSYLTYYLILLSHLIYSLLDSSVDEGSNSETQIRTWISTKSYSEEEAEG